MRFCKTIRLHWAALRVTIGLAYPIVVWAVAQLPDCASGPRVRRSTVDGKPVGSSLIGPFVTDANGNALPKYLQSRPSAAGAGYDSLSTSASNLGPASMIDIPADPDQVREIVHAHQDDRDLGILGEPRVNVLALSLELDQKYPVKG